MASVKSDGKGDQQDGKNNLKSGKGAAENTAPTSKTDRLVVDLERQDGSGG